MRTGELPPRLWQDLFGLLLTLLALIVAAKLAIPRPSPQFTTLPTAQCDPQRESCRLVLPGNLQLDLHLTGNPVSPNQPFNIEITGADPRIRLLSQELRGIEIEMGSPLAAFAADADGNYRSPANIPICTVSSMTWRLAVRLEVAGQYIEWPLLFQTNTTPSSPA